MSGYCTQSDRPGRLRLRRTLAAPLRHRESRRLRSHAGVRSAPLLDAGILVRLHVATRSTIRLQRRRGIRRANRTGAGCGAATAAHGAIAVGAFERERPAVSATASRTDRLRAHGSISADRAAPSAPEGCARRDAFHRRDVLAQRRQRVQSATATAPSRSISPADAVGKASPRRARRAADHVVQLKPSSKRSSRARPAPSARRSANATCSRDHTIALQSQQGVPASRCATDRSVSPVRPARAARCPAAVQAARSDWRTWVSCSDAGDRLPGRLLILPLRPALASGDAGLLIRWNLRHDSRPAYRSATIDVQRGFDSRRAAARAPRG